MRKYFITYKFKNVTNPKHYAAIVKVANSEEEATKSLTDKGFVIVNVIRGSEEIKENTTK